MARYVPAQRQAMPRTDCPQRLGGAAHGTAQSRRSPAPFRRSHGLSRPIPDRLGRGTPCVPVTRRHRQPAARQTPARR